jgi:predicted permease
MNFPSQMLLCSSLLRAFEIDRRGKYTNDCPIALVCAGHGVPKPGPRNANAGRIACRSWRKLSQNNGLRATKVGTLLACVMMRRHKYRGDFMVQLHQTVRRLLRAPGFTLTTVLTLAIGIGATTAIFSVVNGVLLKPLPFPDSDRLIALRHRSTQQDDHAASEALYFTYREHNETFESVALFSGGTATITGAGEPEEVQRLASTHEFLPTLRVTPLFGRTFVATDDEAGTAPTVILSHGYWQRRFGGAENALGQTLNVDGAPHEIVGVLPPTFRFLEAPADILTPFRPNRAFAFVPSIGARGIARLKDGLTLEEASADVARMIPIYIDSFPIVPGLTKEAVLAMEIGPNLRYLKDDVIGDLDDVLWVLMGTIGMLLLIACANVANLALVRTETRSQELAIRAALGAGSGRITRDLLLESAVLGLAGGAVGFALAVAILPVLLSLAAGNLPAALDIAIDPTVLGFAFAISLASGLLFGLIPAIRYAGARVAAVLSSSGRSQSASRERHRARNALVVVQVALALVLLVASGLMIRTFQSLRDVDPGLTNPDTIQTLRISIPQAAVPEFPRVVRMQNDIVDRLAAIPGVESVGFATRLPLMRTGPNGPFSLEDKPDGAPLAPEFRYTSPRYFEALGTPIVAGRDLEWSDHYGTAQVAVISENVARREWGSPAGALGKRVRRGPQNPWIEIVGVAGDIRHHGIDQAAPDAIYLTSSEFLAQFASRAVHFFVRSERAGTPGFMREIEQAVWAVNGNLPVGSVQTLGDIYARSMARTSLTLVLLAITGGMALLLGLIGIYGVISYMLAQRTREIGIRIALGAQAAAVKRLLLGHVLALVAVGIALGLGGAAVLSRLMESLLFGVSSLDAMTYASVAFALAVTAALAGYIPARRATRIDPMAALRSE